MNITYGSESLFDRYKHLFIPWFLLVVLGIAVFGSTLRFPPNTDDLTLLTVVAHRPNPLSFFATDEGLDLSLYRPLHPISLWIVYHLFGTNTLVNQLINLIFHFLIVCIFYHLLTRITREKRLAFVLAALVLIAPYTLSAAMWVSDRPTLFVALALLLFLEHSLLNEPSKLNPWYLGALAIFALLGKENGLILPGLMLLSALEIGLFSRASLRTLATACAIVLGYFGIRYLIFHTFTSFYYSPGFILGAYYYVDSTTLPLPVRLVANLSNVTAQIVAPILPVFATEQGGIPNLSRLILKIPIVLVTVFPFLAAIGKKLSRVQIYALAIIVFNAIIHYSLFRFRNLYVEQIAFCLFVASIDFSRYRYKRVLVLGCLGGLLLYNTFTLSEFRLPNETINRSQIFGGFLGLASENRLPADLVDPQILAQTALEHQTPAPPPLPTPIATMTK